MTSAPAAVPASGWQDAECALCGAGAPFETLLELPHADAPHGCAWLVRCRSCGLRRLTPRPGPDVLPGYYGGGYNAFIGRTRGALKQRGWDLLRDMYAGARGPMRIAAPLSRWVFDISVRVDRTRPPRVLEVGSGYGDLLVYLRSRGCHVQGVDLDPRAAEAGAALGVSIHAGTVETLAADSESFDIGVLCHSLEHVPDPAKTLRTIHALLRPGAELHVAVPNGNATGLAVQGRHWMHLSFPLHFWFFDRATLVELLERCGFKPSLAYSTSRWHQLGAWMGRLRGGDIVRPTREACAIALGSLSPSSGDVLRVTAIRVP